MLTQPLKFVTGIGPQRATLLEKLGLRTVADLLFFFPRSYDDFTQQDNIVDLHPGQDANVTGSIVDIDQSVTANGKHLLYVLLRQDTQFLRAVWFSQPFLSKKFQAGQRVLLRGKVKLVGGRFQMTHPQIVWLDADQNDNSQTRLSPIYRLTQGINQRQMRKMVSAAVQDYADDVEEAIPDSLRQQTDVCGIADAIRQIHHPHTAGDVDTARGRLVFQELLILQLALAIRRHRVRTNGVSPQLEMTPKIRSRILGRLPFQLTASQQTAVNEIAHDMAQSYPMNRLIHGEVGSGKTVVALCAMLIAVAHGQQTAMMAPTEILARQHFQSIQKLLQPSRVRVALWTGSLTKKERDQIAAKIASGEIDIVVGTNAIVASQLNFAKLGLVVIDEQHKFGVRQRSVLKQSTHQPHYLVMTATPIPRTVSMTLFGDLDTSILRRTSGIGQQVNTYLGTDSSRQQWWDFVKKKLLEGRQGFVVAPLVDGDDDSDVSSVERMFESLANGPLADFRLDVLHGRQTPDEKATSMANFTNGQTQIIVATGVVEVGIDVANATVMTILSAERFGLSQLHQLRGRVSRGRHPGFVCAFASSNDPLANERLTAFAQTQDGFELAEIDLKIRGPGNLFSNQQSGFPPLMIADVVRDQKVLARAQQVARRLVAEDAELANAGLNRLRQLVFARYGAALDIADVG